MAPSGIGRDTRISKTDKSVSSKLVFADTSGDCSGGILPSAASCRVRQVPLLKGIHLDTIDLAAKSDL
jgi:hypothetical protein